MCGACRCRRATTSRPAWSSCCRPTSAAGWTLSRRCDQAPLRLSRMALCACFSLIICGSTRAIWSSPSAATASHAWHRTVRAGVQSDALGRAGAHRASCRWRGGCRRREPGSQDLRSAAHGPPGPVARRSRNGWPASMNSARPRFPAVVGLQGGGVQGGGRGLHDRLCPHPDRSGAASPARPQEVEAAGGRWRLHVLTPGDGYVGALAVAVSPADAG